MSRLQIRHLGVREYVSSYTAMRRFTRERTADTVDEFWCLQHPAVFTLGANADARHILSRSDIPVVQSDRGGQVTYHGPGQGIIYLLLDLRRKGIGIKTLVRQIEQSVIDLLGDYRIKAIARPEAHGVYIDDAKIASLGLRVNGGCSYHGVAVNVDMDLSPFSQINPCGLQGVAVTQLQDYGVESDCLQIHKALALRLCENLQYDDIKTVGQ